MYSSSRPDKSILTYALIDDQSNRYLATTHLLILVNSEEVEYSLASCAGSFVFSGRVAEECVLESLDGSTQMNLPALIECNNIPDVGEAIRTPEIARHYSNLMDIQKFIPPLSEARTILLIGRDLPAAYHVLDQSWIRKRAIRPKAKIEMDHCGRDLLRKGSQNSNFSE